MTKTQYEILGVEKNASESDIKKAYRQLSLKYHPDRNGNSQESINRFQEISNANDILSDPEKRKQYDFDLQHGEGSFQQQEQEQDIHNIINQMFGGGFPGMAFNMGGGPNIRIVHNGRPMNMGGMNMGGMHMGGMNMGGMHMGAGFPGVFPGDDPFAQFFQHIHRPPPIETNIKITLEKSYFGGSHPVTIERQTIMNNIRSTEIININITIPQGVNDGEVIVLENHGHSINESTRGDVRICFEIINHDSFKRVGNDLYYQVYISLKEAICGFNISIYHINGKTLSINNNTNPTVIKPNYKKTVPNLGMIRDGNSGNLIIEFTIEFPDRYSPETIGSLAELL